MNPLLQFLLALAIIILVAKASGYLSIRLGQPAVLGELLAGLILGPTVLNMFHWPMFGDPHLEESISHLAHIGVLFLMFVAGLEVDLESMLGAGRPPMPACSASSCPSVSASPWLSPSAIAGRTPSSWGSCWRQPASAYRRRR